MAYLPRLSPFSAPAARAWILSCLACAAASSVACSDESQALPPVVSTGGSAGASGSGGAGGVATAGASAGGAAAGGAAGSGGAGGAPAEPFEPVVLFPFDFVQTGTFDWFVEPATDGTLAVVQEDRDPASTTRGALRFTANFPPYAATGLSQRVTALYQFGDATTGTTRALQGGSRVHFWIRQVTPAGLAPSLFFFQPFIQGGTATGFTNNFGYATADALADNQWHEFVLEVFLAPFMLDVWRVGLAVEPQSFAATPGPDAGDAGPVEQLPSLDAGLDAGDAGGPAPAPVTFDIDYVWVE